MAKYYKDNGETFRIQIERDEYPWNPREEMDVNVGNMMIWWNNYKLGDEKPENSDGPDEYVYELVKKYVPDKTLVNFVKSGKSSNEMKIRYDRSEKEYVFSAYSPYWKKEMDIAGSKDPEALAWDIAEWLTFQDAWKLLARYNIIAFPLYAYEHGGITVSMSNAYPYSDRWDGGQCGWIVTDKGTIMKHIVKYRGDNGRFYNTNNRTWKKAAKRALKEETDLYDMYLQGDCYTYTLERFVPDCDEPDNEDAGYWEEVETFGGYYSDKYGDELEEEISREAVGSYDFYDTFSAMACVV